jgi:hypothetical protein
MTKVDLRPAVVSMIIETAFRSCIRYQPTVFTQAGIVAIAPIRRRPTRPWLNASDEDELWAEQLVNREPRSSLRIVADLLLYYSNEMTVPSPDAVQTVALSPTIPPSVAVHMTFGELHLVRLSETSYWQLWGSSDKSVI